MQRDMQAMKSWTQSGWAVSRSEVAMVTVRKGGKDNGRALG